MRKTSAASRETEMASEAFKKQNELNPSLLLYMVDLIQKLRGNPPPEVKQ